MNLGGGFDHPERDEGPSAANAGYEFIAYAAFEDGNPEPIVGRRALEINRRVPVKVVLDHFAGITGLDDLPQAEQFLRWVRNGEVTREQEAEILRQHFELLMASTRARANAKGLEIAAIVLTYPNFLGPHEKDGDYQKLRSCCLRLVRASWPGVPVEMASEAQVAALYVFEDYEDALCSVDRQALSAHFGGLRGQHGLNVLQVDAGSSTFVRASSPEPEPACCVGRHLRA